MVSVLFGLVLVVATTVAPHWFPRSGRADLRLIETVADERGCTCIWRERLTIRLLLTRFASMSRRRMEVGRVGLGLYRALTEVDDPTEIVSVIVRLSAESRRGVVEEDTVGVLWVADGTHLGEFVGVPATGRHAVWEGITMVRLACGLAAEVWTGSDGLGLRQQLGIISDEELLSVEPEAVATPAR